MQPTPPSLNAPVVSEAISAYAAQLSLGVSVVEYLALPSFKDSDEHHRELSRLGIKLTRQTDLPTAEQWAELDQLARTVFGLCVRRATRVAFSFEANAIKPLSKITSSPTRLLIRQEMGS